MRDNKLVDYLKKHRMFATYGFHDGFGEMVFNSMILDAYKEKETINGFYGHMAAQIRSLAIMQIRDPQLCNSIMSFVSDPQNARNLMRKARISMYQSFLNLNWQQSPEIRSHFNDHFQHVLKQKDNHSETSKALLLHCLSQLSNAAHGEIPKQRNRELVYDRQTKKVLFEPQDFDLDKEDLSQKFNTLLFDFLGGEEEKQNFFTYDCKRVVRAATLMRDRVNQVALKNLVQTMFQSWQRDLRKDDVWRQIEQLTHLNEPIVLPKEFGPMHVEFQKTGLLRILSELKTNYNVSCKFLRLLTHDSAPNGRPAEEELRSHQNRKAAQASQNPKANRAVPG